MENNKKAIVVYDSQGPSGNVFAIIGQAGVVLKKQKRIDEYNQLINEVTKSKSYEEALKIISKFVDLVDLSLERGQNEME